MAQPIEVHPEVAAGLHAIHWPIPTEADALADGLLAGALGLMLALLLFSALRLIFTPTRAADPLERLAATRALPPAERLLAQARLAATLPSDAPLRQRLSAALYRPDPEIDLDALDRDLATALGSR